jgi:hypothetical protein
MHGPMNVKEKKNSNMPKSTGLLLCKKYFWLQLTSMHQHFMQN